jgi:hypothetical protein
MLDFMRDLIIASLLVFLILITADLIGILDA